MSDNRYFAELEPDALAAEIIQRKDDYLRWCLNTGRIGRWKIAFDTYYGQRGNHNSSYVTAAGEQGELSFLMSNEYRSIVQQIIVYTTKNKPAIEPACINSDSDSQAAAILGKNYLEYISKQQRIEQLAKQAMEWSMTMDQAWLYTEFDFSRGQIKMINPLTQKPVAKGQTICSVRGPIDTVIDFTQDNPNHLDWQIKVDLVNKFDLAAQYPEIRDQILSQQRNRQDDAIYRFGDRSIYAYGNDQASPMINRYTLYHRKTPALPQGRFFQCLDGKVTLTPGFVPFDYEELPGTRVCPSEMIGSCMGYSNANDLLALQDVMDSLMSAAVTNMTNFGVNNLWTKPGSGLNIQQILDGMNHCESEEKPEVLVMNHLPPEWFNLTNFIIQRMESISGINSVARGNTAGKDYSGAAMALLQSMAIEFNSGMQMAYNAALENVFNNILVNLQRYGDDELEALVAGKNKQYLVKKFRAAALSPIRRVYIQQSNPFKDTTAGKMAQVEYLLKFPNAIKYPDQIQQVLTTGNLDIPLDPQQKQNICIQDENERLMRGEDVPVVWTENHMAHLSEHLPLTWDNDTKVSNPKALAAANKHLNEHLNQWATLPPDRLAIIGLPPYPGMGMMPPPQGAPAGPGGPPPVNESTQPGVLPESAPADMPNMPKNPLTNQPFDTATGGM